jgi:hypothetical protein
VVTAYEREPAAVGVGFYRVSVGSCSLGRFYDSPMFVGHRLKNDIRAVFQKTIARLPVVCLDRVRLNVCDPSWIDASRYPVLIDQLLPPHSIKPRDPMRVLVFHRDFVEEPETRRSGEPLLSLHIDEHAHGAALFSCAHGGGEFMRLLDVLRMLMTRSPSFTEPPPESSLSSTVLTRSLYCSKASLISALIGASILPYHTITRTLL